MQSFFCPPPAGRRTQQKRGGTRRQRKRCIYNKVWTKREDALNRNIENITENKIITLYF